MTRILFGISLLLATCLVDGYGVAVCNAGNVGTPLVVDIDSDSTDTLLDDDSDSPALFDANIVLIEYPSAPIPPTYGSGHPADVGRHYQIRAPPS